MGQAKMGYYININRLTYREELKETIMHFSLGVPFITITSAIFCRSYPKDTPEQIYSSMRKFKQIKDRTNGDRE